MLVADLVVTVVAAFLMYRSLAIEPAVTSQEIVLDTSTGMDGELPASGAKLKAAPAP